MGPAVLGNGAGLRPSGLTTPRCPAVKLPVLRARIVAPSAAPRLPSHIEGHVEAEDFRLRGLEGLRRLTATLWDNAAPKLAALALAATMLLPVSPAGGVEFRRYPASSRPDIFQAQRTLLEAWSIVQHNFVDSDFGGHDWNEELAEALMAAYDSPSGDSAYQEIKKMISHLGDPYTRIVPPREYADFRVSSDGEVHGVGMLIASDKSSGRLMVLSPLDGSPAARAGVKPGDEVVTIDGHSVHGWDGDKAADFLRGRTGSHVNVRIARRTTQVPGVAGRPPPLYTEYKQIKLKREKLELSPVFSSAIAHDNHTLGYIRLTSFSQKAAADVRRHLQQLEGVGAEAYILDLRNNPGGLVRSGLDIARIFLDGPAAVFTVSGRENSGYPANMQRIVLEDGQAVTHRPLAVLVNHNSASASEILAGALRDNHRAAVIGDRTYGKGKIQSVFELDDGSAVFVTVARYRTPLAAEIDAVGITPDTTCKTGLEIPSGVPLEPESLLRLAQIIPLDGCVMRAEEQLEATLGVQEPLSWDDETNTWTPLEGGGSLQAQAPSS